MKKIIGIIRPFDLHQVFYVYQDGKKLDTVKTTVDEIPQTIYGLSQKYNINQIDLSGSKHYAQGLVKKIIENAKYNNKELIFNFI